MAGKSVTKLGSGWNILIYRFGFVEAEKICTGLKSFHQIQGGILDGYFGAEICMVIIGKKVQQWHQH